MKSAIIAVASAAFVASALLASAQEAKEPYAPALASS